jgi:hypothetical protein
MMPIPLKSIIEIRLPGWQQKKGFLDIIPGYQNEGFDSLEKNLSAFVDCADEQFEEMKRDKPKWECQGCDSLEEACLDENGIEKWFLVYLYWCPKMDKESISYSFICF